ncbi:MAG: hypothetical protein ACKPKO_59170, partial [Candidatus Fonsibacter sp.]
DNPNAGKNADFPNNFSEISHYIVDGELVTIWCRESLKRMMNSQRDAQNPISLELEDELDNYLESIQKKFKELSEDMKQASGLWEKIVDDHL